MADQKRSNFLQFALLFVAIYLGVQLVTGILFPSTDGPAPLPGPVLTAPASFTLGHHPVLQLENRPTSQQSFGLTGWLQSKWCGALRLLGASVTAQECAAKAAVHSGAPITLQNRCPAPPVELYAVTESGTAGEKLTPITSTETVVPCAPVRTIGPGETVEISLAPWKYSLFERTGVFEARLPGTMIPKQGSAGTGAVIAPPTVARFAIKEPGIFTKTFRTFITAPFLNFLVFIASLSPGYSLGIAIIILTLAVKILLFFPTQHALEGQKKMQMLQPKIEALKAQYTDDQKRIQEETMKLWKEHKINPFQSCLPMLIQFPILIGLFYVIRDGSDITLSRHLLYGLYQNLPWQFGTSFLGLDLLRPNILVLPILLVTLQFLQMKLTFAIQKRKKKEPSPRSGQGVIDVEPQGKPFDSAQGRPKEKVPASPQDMQQNMMLYGLPLMIGVFALQFPSAVALYWGVSTLFAIGQQIIVNREHLRV